MSGKPLSIISFYINNEVFAIDTLKVQNILELKTYTKVPNSKEYLLGVINLHGNIFPIADLRMMMKLKDFENTVDTSIIVISNDGKPESMIGLVVDSVKEVFDLSAETKLEEPVISGSTGLINSFIGTIKHNEDFVHIIDINDMVKEIEK